MKTFLLNLEESNPDIKGYFGYQVNIIDDPDPYNRIAEVSSINMSDTSADSAILSDILQTQEKAWKRLADL
ncbi:hypothetical protein KKI24_09025 [bacterium]|nr:hypothetical protein [bacterium]